MSIRRDTCPRRFSNFGPWEREEGLDGWGPHHMNASLRSCTFCGSLHPDEFMARIKVDEPKSKLNFSDKAYKTYVGDLKFYWEHLSEEQMREFVQLWNERKVTSEYGALPYFMRILNE